MADAGRKLRVFLRRRWAGSPQLLTRLKDGSQIQVAKREVDPEGSLILDSDVSREMENAGIFVFVDADSGEVLLDPDQDLGSDAAQLQSRAPGTPAVPAKPVRPAVGKKSKAVTRG